MRKYLDKHGNEIKYGMTIRHDDGEVQKVYRCTDFFYSEHLGVNASNKNT